MANFGAMIRSYVQEKKPTFDIDRLKRFATQQVPQETQDRVRSFGEMAMYNPLQPFVERQYDKYIQSPEGEMFPQAKHSQFAKQGPYYEKMMTGEKLSGPEMNELMALQRDQALVMGPMIGMTAPQAIGPGTRAALVRLSAQQRKGLTDVAYFNTVEGGGVTLSLKGEQPSKGFSHSIMKKQTKVPAKDFKPVHVSNFIKKNTKLLKQPGNHIGFWEDQGFIYLDVARVGPTNPATLQKAIDLEQLAVFDLKNFKDVKLGTITKGVYKPLYEALKHPYFR